MSPRVTLRLIGAFGIWWTGYTLAERTGGNGARGGVLAIVVMLGALVIWALARKSKS